MFKYSQKFFHFFHYWQFVWQRVLEDNCGQMASALTLTTLLSLVPLLTVILTVLGAIPAFQVQAQELMNYVLLHFLPTSVEVIQTYLKQFTAKAAELTVVGGIFLFLTSIIILANIEQALNTIWRVPVKRKGLMALALYWAILTLTPVVIVGSIAVTSYFSLLEPILFDEIVIGNWTKILPFLSTVIVFTLLYLVVPNAKVPVTHALVGGFSAAVLFAGGRWAFRLYVAHSPNYQLLYGALAILPIFAVWVYLSWVFILLGAEITHALRYFYRKSLEKLPSFLIAYRWIGFIWQAQHQGQRLTFIQLLRKQPVASMLEAEEILENLVRNKWVRKTTEGDYILSRDLHEFSLLDLHRSLGYLLPSEEVLRNILDQAPEKFLGDEVLLRAVIQLERALQQNLMPTLAVCYV